MCTRNPEATLRAVQSAVRCADSGGLGMGRDRSRMREQGLEANGWHLHQLCDLETDCDLETRAHHP